MDLILLKPGDDTIVGSGPGASMIGGEFSGPPSLNLENCIELVTCNFSMQQQMTTDVSNSARTSGRPVLHDITCVKYVDKTSPKLYHYCLGAIPVGTKKPTYIYMCRNNRGTDPKDGIINIMTLELSNAMVSSIALQSHPNDMPTEQFTLNFTEIKWIFTVQTNEAETQGQVAAAWSVSKNRAAKA